MLRHNFTASKICNLSETGNSAVHVHRKIVCAKGIRQLWHMISGERRKNVTMIIAVNAIGNHVPPVLIFVRVHYKNLMMTGAPTDSVGVGNPSG